MLIALAHQSIRSQRPPSAPKTAARILETQ
jgi:hypothetical protein